MLSHPFLLLPSPPPPPPSLMLTGYLAVPSPSPTASPSSSIGTSLAIVVIVLIAVITVTCAIVLLRRSYRRRLSSLSFSPRCSFAPSASSSSSSGKSAMWSAAKAVGASPGAAVDMSLLEMAAVSASTAPLVTSMAPSSAESVEGKEAVGSSAALAVVTQPGVEAPVSMPSAPSLPEAEQVIWELLSLPPGPVKPSGSTVCCICGREILLVDELLTLPVCSHTFHQLCMITWVRSAVPPRCPSCNTSIIFPSSESARLAPTFCPAGYDIEAQILVPVPPGKEVAEAVGGSRGWLRSSLATLSGGWSGCSSGRTTAAVVPVSSRRTTGSWSLGSSSRLGDDSCSRRWDVEAAAPTPERRSVSDYFRSLFRI